MKAQLTKQYVDQHFPAVEFYCPQVLSSPQAALAQLDEILLSKPEANWRLIGSSLGGYFSTYFAEKYQIPAVLINPAIKPYILLNEFLGWQTNPYTDERYEVKASFIDDLKAMEQQKITENFYQVMVQTADEVLDYRLATQKFAGSQLTVQQGGDHSFINYEQMLPAIAEFLALK